MKSCFFDSVDMRIHYQTEGSGPLFICLHGGRGNSGDYFFPFLSPLADTFQMVYLDERGSGKSKPVPDKDRVSVPGMAQDIDNLIAHLGARDAIVLGHSFGAYLALFFALHYPSRVRELSLVSGAVTYSEISQGWWPVWFKRHIANWDSTRRVHETHNLYNTGKITADESFRRCVTYGAPNAFYDFEHRRDLIMDTLARTDFTYLGEHNSNFQNEPDLVPRLPEISCPTLLMAGQLDISTPLEHFGAMARDIPHCEMVVVPRAMHFPFIDQPEICVAAIRQFHK
jgi:proline iminopeptidase